MEQYILYLYNLLSDRLEFLVFHLSLCFMLFIPLSFHLAIGRGLIYIKSSEANTSREGIKQRVSLPEFNII